MRETRFGTAISCVFDFRYEYEIFFLVLLENVEKENVERGKYRKKMKKGKYRKGKYRRGKRRND